MKAVSCSMSPGANPDDQPNHLFVVQIVAIPQVVVTATLLRINNNSYLTIGPTVVCFALAIVGPFGVTEDGLARPSDGLSRPSHGLARPSTPCKLCTRLLRFPDNCL